MSLFEKKQQVSRKEFRKAFRKANPIALGTSRKMFRLNEIMQMEKKLFGRKFDASTSKEKYKRLVKEIGKAKYRTPDIPERELINKKIRFLRKLGGV